MILDEIKNYPCVEVCFGAECVGLQEQSTNGTVKAIIYEGVIIPETPIEAKLCKQFTAYNMHPVRSRVGKNTMHSSMIPVWR
jgi:hypothetical protein